MKKGMLIIFAWLGIVGLHAKEIEKKQTAPGNFKLKISLPNDEVTLIDKVFVYVDVTYPPSYHVDLSALRSHLLFDSSFAQSSFTLIDETASPEKKGEDDLLTQQIVFTLSPQIPGKHHLTLLNVNFEPKDPSQNKNVEIISPIFEMNVAMPQKTELIEPLPAPLLTFSPTFPINLDPLNRQEQLKNNDKQRNLNIIAEHTFHWFGMAALIAALIFLLTFKKSGPKKEKIERNRKIEARKKASQGIHHSLNLLNEGKIDDFYILLTKTLCSYIEEYYGIKAASKTTEEFLKDAPSHPVFSEPKRERLQAILEQADKVKYGRIPTTLEENKKIGSLVFQFINESI